MKRFATSLAAVLLLGLAGTGTALADGGRHAALPRTSERAVVVDDAYAASEEAASTESASPVPRTEDVPANAAVPEAPDAPAAQTVSAEPDAPPAPADVPSAPQPAPAVDAGPAEPVEGTADLAVVPESGAETPPAADPAIASVDEPPVQGPSRRTKPKSRGERSCAHGISRRRHTPPASGKTHRRDRSLHAVPVIAVPPATPTPAAGAGRAQPTTAATPSRSAARRPHRATERARAPSLTVSGRAGRTDVTAAGIALPSVTSGRGASTPIALALLLLGLGVALGVAAAHGTAVERLAARAIVTLRSLWILPLALGLGLLADRVTPGEALMGVAACNGIVRMLLATDRRAVASLFRHIEAGTRGFRVLETPITEEPSPDAVGAAHVAVIDAGSDHETALEASRRLKEIRPALPLIGLVCCRHSVNPYYVRALASAGVDSVVDLHGPPEETVRLIRAAAGGEVVLSFAFRRSPAELNDHELELLQLLSLGLNDQELGRRLCLSPHTVKHRLEELRRRLGLRNRIALAAWAGRYGVSCAGARPATGEVAQA